MTTIRREATAKAVVETVLGDRAILLATYADAHYSIVLIVSSFL